jgi:hypothetical protein
MPNAKSSTHHCEKFRVARYEAISEILWQSTLEQCSFSNPGSINSDKEVDIKYNSERILILQQKLFLKFQTHAMNTVRQRFPLLK